MLLARQYPVQISARISVWKVNQDIHVSYIKILNYIWIVLNINLLDLYSAWMMLLGPFSVFRQVKVSPSETILYISLSSRYLAHQTTVLKGFLLNVSY